MASSRTGFLQTLVLSACLLASVEARCAQATEPSEAEAEQPPLTITELVRAAREGTAQRRAMLAERERRFIEERDQRARLFKEIQAKRQAAEAEADRLRSLFESGENELADLETRLDEQSGDLREVFTVVRQSAGDAAPMVQNSMVSAEIVDRIELVERVSRSDYLPTADDIRGLWLLFLEEMTESGRVSRFDTNVIGSDGAESVRRVTRVGTFTSLSEGDYLRYLPDSGRLLALARQPAGVSRPAILAFEEEESPIQSVSLDPSRGSILSLIVQVPDLTERIEQGGLIGYVIIVIGTIGLILGVVRFVRVMSTGRRVAADLADESADDASTVGQLRSAGNDKSLRTDADAMSAKMDEIVTVFSERMRWGLPTLALFAAVSPLLGLLGTVTGMIETFQVITLFGAGDPRLMSGGISQALVTTQLGLSVAIPLLLLHSFLQGRSNSLIARLDEVAANLYAQSRSHSAGD